jgi:hypothetical protein
MNRKEMIILAEMEEMEMLNEDTQEGRYLTFSLG